MTNIRKFSASAAVVVAMSLGAVSVAGAAPAAHRSVAPHATKTVSFTGNYSGTIALLISGTKVTASSVKGTGSATLLGKSTMSGTGVSSAAATCDAMSGTGSLVGSGSKLTLKILAGSKGCGSYPAPTTVSVTGTAKVLSGAGKYKGAAGTLKFSGSFTLPSSTKGSTDKFTAKLSGKLTVK